MRAPHRSAPPRTPRARAGRAIGVLAVLALAIGALTACRTNVGLAADVDGHRISESTVGDYLRPTGPDAAAKKQLGITVALPPARSFALETLIRERLFVNAFAKRGSVPSAARLATYHDRILQGVTGASVERDVRLLVAAIGLKASFAKVYVRYGELEAALATSSGVSSSTEFIALVRRGGGPVRVNPRYGTWSEQGLALDGSRTSGLPGFVQLQPA